MSRCAARPAHHDLAVEYRMCGTIDDALVQLPAHALRPRVIDTGMGIGELLGADQGKPVDCAFGAFARLHHVQIMARNARAQGHAHRSITARVGKRHRAIRDVKAVPLSRCTRTWRHEQWSPSTISLTALVEIGLVGQRHAVLDYRHRAAGFGHHQAARITRVSF